MSDTDFLTKCLAGLEDPARIDDYVHAWHSSEGVESLHAFLGMTWDEYSLWVEKPETLPFLLAARRFDISIADALNLHTDYAAAARIADPDQADSVKRWLKRTGRI